MKVKEATQREVHWLLKWNNGEQANARLQQQLGPLAEHFARLTSGNAGKFQWTKNGEWQSLVDADPALQTQLREQWYALGSQVRQQLADRPQLAEDILTIPNEGYLFYSLDASGAPQLLVTGWGFTNHRRAETSAIKNQKETAQEQPVRISILNEGEGMGGERLQLITPNGVNEVTTDEQGRYEVGDRIPAGTQLTFIYPPTGERKTFEITEGQEEYTWDVTRYTQLQVRATLDGKPLADVPVAVEYHGRQHQLRLDEGGQARLQQLALHGTEPCHVTLGDETQSRPLVVDAENVFDFALTTPEVLPPDPPEKVDEKTDVTPPLPPELPEAFTVTVVDAQQQPLPHLNIQLEQNGTVRQAVLDDAGKATFQRIDFQDGAPINVTLQSPQRTFPPIVFALEPEENDYVLEEQIETPSPVENQLIQALLVLLTAFVLSIVGYFAIQAFALV